jgi:hypothetical protein
MKKRLAFVLGSRLFALLRAFVFLPSFGCGYAASGHSNAYGPLRHQWVGLLFFDEVHVTAAGIEC